MFISLIKTIRSPGYLLFYLLLGLPSLSLAQQKQSLQTTKTEYLLDQGAGDIPEIAISLDDAPMPGTILFSGMDKTKAIIEQLHAVNSPPIGIFALGIHAQGIQNLERLRMYGEAGHIIANHTYHHYRLNDISSQAFIEDIQRAHECLSSLHNFRPLFRFPYLCEGKNDKQRQEVIQALKKMGYQEGYVTISNHDYHISKLVVQAANAGKKINYEKLKKVYIDILWSCIQTYDQLSYQVVKRKVKHVLLLHENDLAALFIGDLINYIRAQGWKVISIEEAYQDPISTIDITNNYHYSGRIAAIAVEKGLGKGLIDFPESTHVNYIAKALQQEKVFVDP
jgi:peptidoglycan/xylan/chitin deacetylase (PgdA/CDA1 family)